ncbi:DNA translocase FtsK [Candidatus Omnitrophota bacterium]
MKERRFNEIKGLILAAISIMVLASLISFTPYDLSLYTSSPNIPPNNFLRTFGALLAGAVLFLFGWAAYAIPGYIAYIGIRYFRQEKLPLRLPKIIGVLVLLISLASLVGMASAANQYMAFSRGGFLGFVSSNFVTNYFGKLGGYIIFLTLVILSFVLASDILISSLFLHISERIKSFFALILSPLRRRGVPLKVRSAAPNIKEEAIAKPKPAAGVIPAPAEKLFGPSKPKIQIKEKSKVPPEKVRTPPVQIGDYQLPSLDLLDVPPPLGAKQIKEDLTASARILEETLGDFGISAKVTDIERGPIITRYELEPAPGVKVNRIVALSDDIALAMKAQSVRIVAPIPGKGRVGIEVPNLQSNLVYFKDVLSSKDYQNEKSKLALALGKDIGGMGVVAELDDMPHLLIAGTTGSGKTVCVNCLILSMLFRSSPNELKFLMIDPKMVELAPFNGLPHLLCPVVTEAKKAAVALNWVVSEMEDRYRLLSKAGARNIASYNQKQEKLPFIVVVVDELADLMTVARDKIEDAITRLAQLSRAVGIHLILATQRPSVDVITGVIKANFPARISFKVASKVDSRTVLDMNGADKLLGRGDMLFLQPGESKLTRIQGSLVSDKEIERVVEFIKSQAEPVYDDEILKEQQKSHAGGGEKDELYDEAVRVVMESNQASVSILQRRMRLGYTRAARIIDSMEQEGLIGPFEGSKPRRIIVDREPWLKQGIVTQENQE